MTIDQKIEKLTNEHLFNKINYFKRVLNDKPERFYYIGDSDYAEDAVEQENYHNDLMAKKISKYIENLILEAKKRGLITLK